MLKKTRSHTDEEVKKVRGEYLHDFFMHNGPMSHLTLFHSMWVSSDQQDSEGFKLTFFLLVNKLVRSYYCFLNRQSFFWRLSQSTVTHVLAGTSLRIFTLAFALGRSQATSSIHAANAVL